ncbi:MAG: C26 family cysteine hydrolase domain-containing family [Xanthomonadales bacterium]|nr:gamma-glutamyl-gamma-aminobutyrate hydrolase family protein [Gammaproteobacteria bacterium]MBT8052987.1 gamma-glutamyl-gamma-aminobutyrate hydrolase family protein [Gammaproteobacteria bacterium]NND57879.1 C26 family cysteine hydrolase domain-containing family [Xanthomonadales bacterium]NNK50759.1 C26 family cysteine hydrolase domain-containing family [Xanthomonadales bacterium]
MNILNVVQHTSADYLGLMEDHLEGRRIRFRYFRPFTEQGLIPQPGDFCDGLFLLGGGPWGSAGGRDVPTLAQEIELTRNMLDQGKPVIGIGLGAQILAIAAGGSSQPGALVFETGYARRVQPDALAGFMPERFPNAVYMRDRPVLPGSAQVLAEDEAGRPAVFQVGENALGFTGHPGFKTAMAEDLIMEFEESPEHPAVQLQRLQVMVREIEDSLVPIMTGIIKLTGLMQSRHRIPLKLKG